MGEKIKYFGKQFLTLAIIFTISSITLNGQNQTDNDNAQTIRRVVLLNSNPWEVLMSRNGEIMAKLKYLPDYFDSVDEKWKKEWQEEKKDIYPEVVNSETQYQNTNNEDVNSAEEFGDIYFLSGSALLRKKQIQTLNKIAKKLKENKNLQLKLLGFTNEPDLIATVLGKRRMDAVVTYLKIKGVDIDNQVKRGSTVKGVNSKVVYFFKN